MHSTPNKKLGVAFWYLERNYYYYYFSRFVFVFFVLFCFFFYHILPIAGFYLFLLLPLITALRGVAIRYF